MGVHQNYNMQQERLQRLARLPMRLLNVAVQRLQSAALLAGTRTDRPQTRLTDRPLSVSNSPIASRYCP